MKQLIALKINSNLSHCVPVPERVYHSFPALFQPEK